MTTEDKNDIKTIAEEVKNMVIKFDLEYDQSAVAELLYDVDMSMRAILEIINGPTGGIEKMVEINDKDKRLEALQKLSDLDQELGIK
jgi:hypothetical protein